MSSPAGGSSTSTGRSSRPSAPRGGATFWLACRASSMSSTTAARRSTSPTAACEHAGRHERAVAAVRTGARPPSRRRRGDVTADRGRETLHITPQSIAEFWAVATRPPAQNGLVLKVASAASAVQEIERTFGLLLSEEAMVYEIGSA